MEVRKYANKLMELVETGVLDPVDVVRMCVKWMSEDDVREMMKANEIDYDYRSEEYEEEEIDALYHDASEEELRRMGCFDNLNEEDE